MDIAARTEALRRSIQTNPPRRIIVLCREHVGDLVNTTAGLLCLRQNFPSAHIVVEAGERALPVLDNFPGIDELWPRPTHQGLFGKLKRLVEMRKCRFDLCVILDDSNDMVQWARWARIPRVVGVWRGKKHEHLFDAYVQLDPSMHEVRDHNRSLLERIGLNVEGFRPRLFPSEADHAAVDIMLQSIGIDAGKGFVAIHPGASEPVRRWPPERFGAVAKALIDTGRQVVVLGGLGDEVLVQQVVSACDPPPFVLDRRLSVMELAALLSGAQALLCNDTGPMHIAATMGTPVVALFGPTDPAHTGPWGEGHALLRGDCACNPRGIESCSGECVRSVTAAEVVQAALEVPRCK